MDAIAYANACFSAGGFRSMAPPPLADSCKPGAIVPGCKSARRLTATLVAATPTDFDVDPFASYQVIAIVDIASAADVSLDAWTVDGESLFTKVENTSGAFVDGLGLVSSLTPELYRSGLNPLPPQPLVNNVHPGVITFTSVLGGALDVFVYLGNPPA
jgi:hypothetical protein